MKLLFATKRNANGYRKFLGIDTERKEFARDCSQWYGREDITEITAADREKLIDTVTAAGFTEIDFMPR